MPLYSHILKREFLKKTTCSTLRTIDHYGGLDAFLLNCSKEVLKKSEPFSKKDKYKQSFKTSEYGKETPLEIRALLLDKLRLDNKDNEDVLQFINKIA